MENSPTILFIVLFCLFVMASIRYNIGTDYYVYYEFFKSVKPLTLNPSYIFSNQYFEPLFLYVSATLKHIFDNPIFHFSFWAFLTSMFFFVGIKKESSHYIMSAFILYCIFYHHYFFNTIRQGVVMAIFIYSTRYIFRRDFLKILFISSIASLIHSSGFLILFSYFISFIRFNSRFQLIIIVVASLLIWQTGIGESIFTFIAIKFEGIIPNLYTYIKLFLYDHQFTQVLQRFLLLIPMIYFYPELSEDNNFSKLFSIYFIGIIIYLVFGFFGLFITRINMFFRILEILLIPIMYQKIINRKQKLFAQICIAAWCFIILTWVYFKDAYYPFKTIFGDFF
ncbi:MAG: hypothetical protein CMG00_01470 [Candidatus Marinimicrobia bacterium]|nr:hypothetical protein [Candidatus Neomarinimicrobiota bacterium]